MINELLSAGERETTPLLFKLQALGRLDKQIECMDDVQLQRMRAISDEVRQRLASGRQKILFIHLPPLRD